MYNMLKVTRGGTYVNCEGPVRLHRTLQDRLTAAVLGGFSKSVVVFGGYPQGGVLSPLLWYLIDGLIARLNVGGICTQGYADDIVC